MFEFLFLDSMMVYVLRSHTSLLSEFWGGGRVRLKVDFVGSMNV